MKLTVSHLKTFLILVAIHSFGVAIGLIFFPSSFFEKVGYHSITEPFFRVQGGVFHLVMVVAYLFASSNPVTERRFVVFSISAKFLATVFLLSYFFLVDPILVVLLSGISDLSMGLILLFLFFKVIPTKEGD